MGFEPSIPSNEQPQTPVLVPAATGTGQTLVINNIIIIIINIEFQTC